MSGDWDQKRIMDAAVAAVEAVYRAGGGRGTAVRGSGNARDADAVRPSQVWMDYVDLMSRAHRAYAESVAAGLNAVLWPGYGASSSQQGTTSVTTGPFSAAVVAADEVVVSTEGGEGQGTFTVHNTGRTPTNVSVMTSPFKADDGKVLKAAVWFSPSSPTVRPNGRQQVTVHVEATKPAVGTDYHATLMVRLDEQTHELSVRLREQAPKAQGQNPQQGQPPSSAGS
jgi:hypothetical protein